jgi:hypothetical protein
MDYYIYWYPVEHPDEPGCFKLGYSKRPKSRMGSHTRKLQNGYHCGDKALLGMIAVGPSRQRASYIEGIIGDWLVERGFPLAGLEIEATRTEEKEREQRTGRKRTSKEIFRRNGRAWHTIDATVRQHVESLL